MNNRRAKLVAGATVLGLGALGGVAMSTNQGVPASGQLAANGSGSGRDERERHGRDAARRREREHSTPDRHPRQRRRADRDRRLTVTGRHAS